MRSQRSESIAVAPLWLDERKSSAMLLEQYVLLACKRNLISFEPKINMLDRQICCPVEKYKYITARKNERVVSNDKTSPNTHTNRNLFKLQCHVSLNGFLVLLELLMYLKCANGG